MQSFSPPFTKHRARQGGGVAIYARNNVACTRICELELEGVEWVWVKVRLKREIIMICCIYLPPNQNIVDFKYFLDTLSDSVAQAQAHLPSVITILGDFNLGNIYLAPDHIIHSGVTNIDVLFQETMYGLNMEQIIREPTRITDRTANLRDLILVSNRRCICEYGLLSPFSHIDHIPTFTGLRIKTEYKKPCRKIIWNYHEMNRDAFIHILEDKDWTEILNKDLDEAVNALTQFILDASNQCIPKRNISVRSNDKPWVRKALKYEIDKRNKLFRRAKFLNTEEEWNHWKEQRNFVTCMNRRLKGKHINQQVKKLLEHKHNPYRYHQILKKCWDEDDPYSYPHSWTRTINCT